MAGARRRRGFTLIELLVALAILALSLTVVLRVFGDGLRGTARAEDYVMATELAQSTLARLGVETASPLEPGTHVGRHGDRFTWRATIERLSDGTSIGGDLSRPDLYDVRVSVFWQENGSERSVTLQTIRLGADDR